MDNTRQEDAVVVMDDVITPEVQRVAVQNGITPEYASAILLPDEPRLLTDEERAMRAKLVNDLYSEGLSLRDVAEVCGGLSRERIRQIMRDYGYDTRPLPGSKRWRDARKVAQQRARVAELAAARAG